MAMPDVADPVAFGDVAPFVRVDRWGIRADQLFMHRRPWSEQQIARRLQRPGSAGVRVSSSAATAQLQLADFARRHEGANLLDPDDAEDAAVLAADAEAARKAEALGIAKKPAAVTRARQRGNALKLAVATSESVALKYMVALNRLLHVARTIPASVIRRLMNCLSKIEGESVVRSGHESFKALRQPVFMDRATAPVAPVATVGAPQGTPPTSVDSRSPVTSQGGESPLSGPAFAPPPPVGHAVKHGAGLTKQDAVTLYNALDIFHDGYLALRPTLAALVYVGGARRAADFFVFISSSLAAHNAIVTQTDMISMHRFATDAIASHRSDVLALASLGRVDDAVRIGSKLRGVAAAAPSADLLDDMRVLQQIERLRTIFFVGERESIAWFEAVDAMNNSGDAVDVVAAIASESMPVRR